MRILTPRRTSLVLALPLSWLLGVLWVCGGATDSWASSTRCKKLYQQKQYEKASDCFFALAKPYLPNKNLGANKGRVGFAVLNAAVSMRKAARASRLPAYQSYLRERVIQYLRLFLGRKLYESSNQKRVATLLKEEMYQKIGYARLTVTTPSKKVQILVLGFRFQDKSQGLWSKEVRPGRFSVIITAPGKTPVTRTLDIRPREPVVIALLAKDLGMDVSKKRKTPPPPLRGTAPVEAASPPSNVSSWILIGLGTALAVGSVGCFGAAMSSRSQADEIIDEELKKSENERLFGQTRVVIGLQNHANTLVVGGWLFAGTAVVAVAVGGLLFLLRPAKTQTKVTLQPKPFQSPSLVQQLGVFE